MPIAENFSSVSASHASVAGATVLSGSEIDTGPYLSLSYTIKVATEDVDWQVFGANIADYSDEVSVQANASVAAAAVGSYSTTQAVWRYYRVKIKDTVGGTHGTATVSGIAKPG